MRSGSSEVWLSQTLICNKYFIPSVKDSLGSPFVVSKLGVGEAIGAGGG